MACFDVHVNPIAEQRRAVPYFETQSLVAVPLRVLRRPVASLREHQADIENALDLLFHGY